MVLEEENAASCSLKVIVSEASSPDKLIVQVISNLTGTKQTYNYNVEINKINPENASRLEMFALCSYVDRAAMGTESADGLFRTFKVYEEIARRSGILKQADISEEQQFWDEPVDWVKVSESVCDILKDFRDSEIIELYFKGKELLKLYEKYLGKEERGIVP